MWFTAFFCGRKALCTLQPVEQFSKLSIGGATIGAQMAGKKLKI